MNNSDKIVGVLFIAVGLMDLLRLDWIHFGLLSSAGGFLLLNPEKSKLMRGLQAALLMIAVVLMFVRIASYFSS